MSEEVLKKSKYCDNKETWKAIKRLGNYEKILGKYGSIHCDSPSTINKIIDKIGDAFCDEILSKQFKKREKHPWRNVTFSNTETKSITLL